MMANIIFVVEGVKMKSYKITIEDLVVQRWFNYLYDQGRLGATVERITKYYIDCILQPDEEELKECCAVKTKKNSFISRTLKKFDRKGEYQENKPSWRSSNINIPFNFI